MAADYSKAKIEKITGTIELEEDTESEMLVQDAVYADIADLLRQLADKVEMLESR